MIECEKDKYILEVEIDPLESEMCEEVYEIAAQCLPEHWSLSTFNDTLRYENYYFYVAKCVQTKKIVGYVGIMQVADETELLNIAVRPEKQKNGIGQQLLDVILRKAAELLSTRILLEVREYNIGAIKLYEKNGFFVLAKREGYYTNPKEDAIIMQKTL